MKLALVLSSALVLLLALASTDCGNCNASCEDFIVGTGAMTGDVSTATDTTVCIAAACSTVPITFDASGDAVATYAGAVTGTLKMTPAGAVTLVVTAKANGFHDGDAYGLLVNSSAGTLVSKTSAPITYGQVDACGKTCKQANYTF